MCLETKNTLFTLLIFVSAVCLRCRPIIRTWFRMCKLCFHRNPMFDILLLVLDSVYKLPVTSRTVFGAPTLTPFVGYVLHGFLCIFGKTNSVEQCSTSILACTLKVLSIIEILKSANLFKIRYIVYLRYM